MTYLEAQNRDPARPDTGVSFTKTVWPFLVSKGMEVEACLFGACGRIAGLGPGGVERLGRLAALDRRKLEQVRHLSYYGGNMNVLFRATSPTFLKALIAPWPVLQVRDDDDLFPPSWSAEEREAFLALVAVGAAEGASFCFGHDGDPLFVFAGVDTIRALALGGTGQE